MSDLFSGWFDNQVTHQREYWDNGKRGRYAHRSSICPHSVHAELRAPWLSNRDLPKNSMERAA